jgi:predicted HTH transcriptional regulator
MSEAGQKRNVANVDELLEAFVALAEGPWDQRPCASATVNDLDLLALRDALQRMGVVSPERPVESFLSDEVPLSPVVPTLLVKEPLTGRVRPRNFAVLLFGRNTQRFVPGAFSFFSIYPGLDRSDAHALRHELAGNLLEQARQLTQLLDAQAYTLFDKTDPVAPNSVRYPKRALYEAMGNALAHRDYELMDPTRITVFSDRIEVLSPGPLPPGVDPVAFREGRSPPRWRNQTLAWFFNRLALAQTEGQGIPTILRTMREEGCPPPTLEADEIRVLCVLRAHPRAQAQKAARSRRGQAARRKRAELEALAGAPADDPWSGRNSRPSKRGPDRMK